MPTEYDHNAIGRDPKDQPDVSTDAARTEPVNQGGKPIEAASQPEVVGTGTPHRDATKETHVHQAAYLDPVMAAYATRAAVDLTADGKSLKAQVDEPALAKPETIKAADTVAAIYDTEKRADHNGPEVGKSLIALQGEPVSDEHTANMVIGSKTHLVSMDKGLSHEDSNQDRQLGEPKETSNDASREQNERVGDAEPASEAQKE